ncbi:hypothetical protein L1987_46398 [Smallanthus sonchifolius]|uniref:Uncharacterized protein n=1 Tax=Smallanthus sonchifolius TaxID=185202 RepID=A0ACB9FZF9_9ASTR|nr:hypothetical protein L1987_46398 [Smallanthus sonchifolius]
MKRLPIDFALLTGLDNEMVVTLKNVDEVDWDFHVRVEKSNSYKRGATCLSTASVVFNCFLFSSFYAVSVSLLVSPSS